MREIHQALGWDVSRTTSMHSEIGYIHRRSWFKCFFKKSLWLRVQCAIKKKTIIYFHLATTQMFNTVIAIGSRRNASRQSETTATGIAPIESSFAHRRRYVRECRWKSIVNIWFATGHPYAHGQPNDGDASCKWCRLILSHTHQLQPMNSLFQHFHLLLMLIVRKYRKHFRRKKSQCVWNCVLFFFSFIDVIIRCCSLD